MLKYFNKENNKSDIESESEKEENIIDKSKEKDDPKDLMGKIMKNGKLTWEDIVDHVAEEFKAHPCYVKNKYTMGVKDWNKEGCDVYIETYVDIKTLLGDLKDLFITRSYNPSYETGDTWIKYVSDADESGGIELIIKNLDKKAKKEILKILPSKKTTED